MLFGPVEMIHHAFAGLFDFLFFIPFKHYSP